jgi:hypothetical protein
MEATYPKDGIFLFNDVLTNEECEYVIDVINKYAVKGREKHGPIQHVIADSVNIMELSEPGLKKRVCDLIFEKITDMCNKFSEVYNIRMAGFESPALRKIRGATKLHIDGILSGPSQGGRNMSII